MSGLRLGNYLLEERLGLGGTAEVFRATPMGHRADAVAVKRMLPHLAGEPGAVNRFLREGEILARVRHPRVVQMLHFGVEGGLGFLVLEHLDGVDLASLWLREPLGAEVGLQLGLAVAEALDGLHRARDPFGQALGLVHGDVSPGNVMVTRRGQVKLIDLGAARCRGESPSFRSGTPGFVAPEVARGGPISVQSDLYGLGRLLQRSVGRPPGWAQRLIHALTSADPARRPHSAFDVVQGLRAEMRNAIVPLGALLSLTPRSPVRTHVAEPTLRY